MVWVFCLVEGRVIEGDDGVVSTFAQVVEGGFQGLLDLGVFLAQISGNGQVKQQVGVACAGDHAEVVDGQPGIPDMEDAGDQIAHPVGGGVVGHHGVVVDHQMDAVLLQHGPLHVVDDLVALHGVLVLVHLHMEAGEPLAGAVVVDHQVVVAQDLGPAADEVSDELALFGVGALAQQGGDGVLGQIDAAPEDEGGHSQTHDTVHLPAGHTLDDGGGQDGGGGQAVIAAVGGGGHQGGGIDHHAQLGVEPAEPELDGDGAHQNGNGDPLQFHGGGVQDLTDGGLGQLIADDEDQARHGKAGQILEPGVAEGVVLVGGLLRQVEAQQGHDGGAGVGEVVHGVGGDGHGTGQSAHRQLQGKEQKIADNAHNTRQPTGGGTGFFAFHALVLPDKGTQKKISHSDCLLIFGNKKL